MSPRIVAAIAALAMVAAGCGTGTPTIQPAASEPTSATTATTSGSTTAGAAPTSKPADPVPADSTTEGSRPLAGEAELQAFSQCMRDNGIAEFPDPGPDGISLHRLNIDPDSPQFKAATAACNELRPPPDMAGSSGAGSAGGSDWTRVVPGGDCLCADGSDFAFWERRTDVTKLVFYLDGGGICVDATTCAFTGTGGENDYYDFNLSTETPGLGDGIFDFDRADNPFADYSFIYVPLCTGDIYLGDATVEYSPELTVEHNGFVNGMAALNYVAENYSDATQVVVVGKTAGSVAAPIYGGLLADLFPDAQVTVFGAQSGHLPDEPDFNANILGELWDVFDNMPDWEVNDGLTARELGHPAVLDPGRPPRPRPRHGPLRLRLRPQRREGAATAGCRIVDPRADRRKRGGDRGRRGGPPQLHRTRRGTRDLGVRSLLRAGGQRRQVGRLDLGAAHRGTTARRPLRRLRSTVTGNED